MSLEDLQKRLDDNTEKIMHNLEQIENNASKIDENSKNIEKNSYALEVLREVNAGKKLMFAILVIVLLMWFLTLIYFLCIR